MGNDGGSFARRSEVVKQRKRKQKIDKHNLAQARARVCALSKEAFKAPLVVCKRGLVYNKEEVLKRYFEKMIPYEFRHIKKISKDTVNVNKLSITDDKETMLQCAVSQIPFNGLSQFTIGFKCGCIISELAEKELSAGAEESKEEDSKLCSACSEERGDIISLN